MRNKWKFIKHIDEIFAGTCLFVTVFVTAINVFTRYLFTYSIPWAQEITLTSFEWSIMIGMSCAYRHNMHYGMDFLVTAIPPKYSRFLRIGSYVVMFVGCAVMTYFSIIITSQGWYKVTNYFHMPYAYKYIACVIGFALMSIYSIRYLIIAIKEPNTFYKIIDQGAGGLAADMEHLNDEQEAEV